MSETEDIKARLPIEQVIGSYIPLKKAGRIYKALCPFHGEKTPSFTVSPERGIFKCFGCNEGGDIFDFVMKIDGLSFPETVEMLAERAGVELQPRESQPDRNRSTGPGKERLLKVNAYAARLWHAILTKHPKAGDARQYLTDRGLSSETIVTFELGYAPYGTATKVALQKAGFSAQEIAQAGDPSVFQDRITFPICDISGRPVGFTGRLLELKNDPRDGKSRGPKYRNTPETPLFTKSRVLYALNLAKRAIQEEGVAILAEGQMDVVMLHQAGYPNAVASSGTALTSDQIRLLARFTTSIAFAYDQDAAGIEATKRGIELVLAAELNPFVVVIPQGKDPADCLKTSPDLWREAYLNRLPFMEWLISQALSPDAELTPVRKKQLAQELLPWIAQVKDPVERVEWLRQTAARLQTEEKNLEQALARLKAPRKTIPPTQPTTGQIPPPSPPSTPTGPAARAELAVALLLAFPTLLPHLANQLPSLHLVEATPFLKLVLPIVEAPGDHPLPELLRQQLSETEQKGVSLYIQELLHHFGASEFDETLALEELMLITNRLRSDAKEEAKSRLSRQIRFAQETHDTVKLKELFSELKNLI